MPIGKRSALQERVLRLLADVEPRWTLTGGAALAGFHTQHRATRDLDLFFRPHAALVGGVGVLLLEIAVLHHPGELDDAFQLELAPAAADSGALQRVGQAARFVAEALPGGIQRHDALEQLGPRFDAAALGVPDFTVHLLERPGHRRQQIFDRLLALVDIRGCLGARFAQARLSEGEECFVVGSECVGAEGLKGFAQPRFAVLVCFEALRKHGAGGDPADQRAKTKTED